ncbi:uncharacterized protein N7484_009587 [Penicillium longicatenatum]|uniref:uncharacterized protein n=1 Tax=Penicillium longicatenatum TaxID=1561947 RepID=UPI00254984B6|nr:uncharacterized protein N7484_009587 [Penicillium longicatenatum]KAJ5636274.1 hypothetical protein N7484_009587 [Penicillium longicatenatum]
MAFSIHSPGYDTGEEIKWKELVRLVHLQLHNDVDMHFRWEINLGQDWRGFMFRSGIEGRWDSHVSMIQGVDQESGSFRLIVA